MSDYALSSAQMLVFISFRVGDPLVLPSFVDQHGCTLIFTTLVRITWSHCGFNLNISVPINHSCILYGAIARTFAHSFYTEI